MSVEISLKVDGRTVVVDIEPNSLQALKDEFNEYCNEDEALKLRRESWAPTYSMYGDDEVLKEVKRKHLFCGGETVVIQWTSLDLTAPSKEPSKLKAPLLAKGDKSSSTSGVVMTKPKNSGKQGSSNMQDQKKKKEKQVELKNANHTSKSGSDEKDTDMEVEFDSDDSDYGLVTEYFNPKQWRAMTKEEKKEHKKKFDYHEEQLQKGVVTTPYQPNIILRSSSSSSCSNSSPNRSKGSKRKERNIVLYSDSDRESDDEDNDDDDDDNDDDDDHHHDDKDAKNDDKDAKNDKAGSNNESRRRENVLLKDNGQNQPGSSRSTPSADRPYFDKNDVMKMKPRLPQYNIPRIFEKIQKRGNDNVKETIKLLNESGILIGNNRRLIIRILVRHLFFKIAKNPKETTPDMREGLAKAFVLEYPKFQEQCDGKTTFPWKSLFDRQGRGWMANAARPIQKKYRTKKSPASKRRKTHDENKENEEFSEADVQELALLMPGRAEKCQILDGMKDSFNLRQEARKREDSVSQMLETFPHLANYDGEVLQEEFKRLRPNAQDMTLNFQKRIPNIIALGTTDNVNPPLENDDALKALLILSQKLPRDIRNRSDPRKKSTKADFHDILEIVQLGHDIDQFVSEKVAKSKGPIQPYLVMVKSPLRNTLVKCFLILDQKPVQLSTTSTLKSLEFLLKTYFIFNVKYPLGWRGVFHCLATCFANVLEDNVEGKRLDSITPSERDFMNSINHPST